jgi:acetyl-CoA/propionyl-CoA carboxylase, biotin carboxylase, biotin carboxyl carrier protein
MSDEAMTPREVAAELGVTVRTVQRWIATGRLAGTQVGGRWRVSRSSLTSVGGPALAPPAAATGIGSLLIANRGEVVVRIARTARRLGIRTIGVQARGDVEPAGVDLALPVSGYLDARAILDAARRSGADAIHPGYGFLAESAAFAGAVSDAGLRWIGPPASAMAAMGDKAAARRAAAAIGVPVIAGYDGSAQDEATLTDEAQRIGFPLMVKPAAGGGGKGMRVVREASGLSGALAAARREAAGAFGDDRLILERLVDAARHVEVQVLFDSAGNGVHLGERDCSAQRRHQKVIEEAPAPHLSAALREELGQAAVRLAASAGYLNAGTVEFLIDGSGAYFFLEMNTRLQVEHPVTELVTGRDLVADQLRVAAGGPLGIEQAALRWRGHAIEARIYAEDPEAGFLPSSGRVVRLHWPGGVRVDTAIAEGDLVSDRYDPLLAKLIAHGADRAEALARLGRALDETVVLGVRTNLRYLRWLLLQPQMRGGEMRTDTLDALAAPHAEIPHDAWRAAGRALLEAGATGTWGGGWRGNAPAALHVAHNSEERRIEPGDASNAEVGLNGNHAFVDVNGQSEEFVLAAAPTVEEAVRHAAAHAGGTATLVAPMPGRVIAVRVVEGASVEAHGALIVLEAMKMEHAVVTPLAGTVTRLAVKVGQQVQRGDLLAEVSA